MSPSLGFTPTPEQQAIVDAVTTTQSSVMVTAYAGCSKTTTLELAAKALPPKRSLILAFNVKNKKEFEKRFPKHFTCLTMNGLGHRAWGTAIGKKLTVDGDKVANLVSDTVRRHTAPRELWNDIRLLVARAQSRGLVHSETQGRGLVPDTHDSWEDLALDLGITPDSTAIALAREVLLESTRQAYTGLISYDDQIYMSALFGGVFERYPLVMVDEAQDLSPLNHIQLRKVASGRLIVVGDPKQSIYAFRGADAASMGKIRALREEWVELPLATTFRCPQVIVQRVSAHAPGFTAYSGNPKGKVHSYLEWTWPKVEALVPTGGTPAVLCRNNAPLLSLAFKLIRQGVGVVFLGRDLGRGLVALSRKIIPEDDIPAAQCLALIEEWRASEISVALANNKEAKAELANDRAECLKAVIDSAKVQTSGALRERITELFAKTSGRVTLATVHGAKGLEWDLVVHLDPFRIPSRKALARGGVDLEQEHNILYVLETRTKHTLVLVPLEGFS